MTSTSRPAGPPAGRHRAAGGSVYPDLPDGYDDPTRPESFVPQQLRDLYRVDEDWELVELAAEMSRWSGLSAALGRFPDPVRVGQHRAVRIAYIEARARALATGAGPAGWPPASLDLSDPVAPVAISSRDEPAGGYRSARPADVPPIVADYRFMLGRVAGVELPRHADAAAIAEWRHRMRLSRAAAELDRNRSAS